MNPKGRETPVLSGIRVIDLSRTLSGPFCSMMLADQGAEVIKVEVPGRGDDARQMPPLINGESAFFISINRGKKSVTLNLKQEAGVKLLYKLVEKSDVFLENFRPGVTQRLSIDYDTLSKINSKLIYCSISGFGQTGPYSTRAGYNFTIQAMSGVMTMTGHPGDEPSPVGISVGDIPPGMFAAFAIMLALYKREKSGQGEYIDIAMFDSLISLMENPIVRFAATGVTPSPIGDHNPSITPFGIFPTRDEKIVIAIGNNKLWKVFCQVLGAEELIEDERFATNPRRTENRSTLFQMLKKILVTRPAADWLQLLTDNGIPVAPINTVDRLFTDPQVADRKMLMEIEQPRAGMLKIAGTPVKLSNSPAKVQTPAPLLGEHTDEMMEELLGLSSDEIESLRKARVI